MLDGFVHYKDKDLKKRWHCLWRMRKDGKLNSIQLGGCGPYLTSDAEIARIEAPPDITTKAGPRVDAQGTGRVEAQADRQSNPRDKRIESDSQAFPSASMNGGA